VRISVDYCCVPHARDACQLWSSERRAPFPACGPTEKEREPAAAVKGQTANELMNAKRARKIEPDSGFDSHEIGVSESKIPHWDAMLYR
jgi:hypothetical protein